MANNLAEKTLRTFLMLVVSLIFLDVLYRILAMSKLTLTHLGSGNFKASPTEETVFEYTKTEPFTITGYINLKNMAEGDITIIREYIKLAIDDEYTLYAEEEYRGKQKEPIINIEKLPAMKGVKITIQQTAGEMKYYPWEFYSGVVG